MVEPVLEVDRVQPRLIPLREHRAHGTRSGVAQHHAVGVLHTVQVLDRHGIGPPRPPHAGDVVVARVGIHGEPRRLSPVRRHDAHPRGRLRGAGLGVLDRYGVGVQRIGRVDEQEVAHARRVQLPKRETRPVRAPPEPVGAVPGSEEELFLVHPVEPPVQGRPRPVGGERDDPVARHPLYVEVVLTHVRDPRCVRRELGVHERRLGSIRTHLSKPTALEIEHPVVAPGVETPDAARIGEDQQLTPVIRPAVVGDGEGAVRPGRHERGGRHQNLMLTRPRIVSDDVTPTGRLLGALQRGVAVPVEPAGRSEPLPEELRRRKDAIQRQGVGFLGHARRWAEHGCGDRPAHEEGDADLGVQSTTHVGPLPLRRRQERARLRIGGLHQGVCGASGTSSCHSRKLSCAVRFSTDLSIRSPPE